MISVAALGKSYGSSSVLHDVAFDVSAGATAAILGPSGSGKSTLLRCLVGLEHFDRGTITVEGAAVHGLDRVSKAAQLNDQVALRGRVGMVFQSFELFPHMTVLDNCTLAPMRVHKRAREAAEHDASRLLDQLGLADKARSYPDHLSGGQRQRVAIARALAMGPRVLLYDEPTSALDSSLKDEVKSTIRAIGATGVTQIVVTHDVGLARDLAGRVFQLSHGRMSEA